nr:protein LOW PSII ACCUMULATION 1, chloroplastic [Ipomoea batatas]
MIEAALSSLSDNAARGGPEESARVEGQKNCTFFGEIYSPAALDLYHTAANSRLGVMFKSSGFKGSKIRSEVLSPFRSVRMFFYLAFIASGSLGGFIATSQLIGALANSSRAAQVPEIAQGLAIDIGAVSIFAFLYYRENRAKNAQIAKLSREENLSNLKLRVDEKRILPVSDFRGIARLVILAGPSSFISECFKLSEPFTDALVERGVLVVPFVLPFFPCLPSTPFSLLFR